ncbi:nitrogen regulation protein NR(II), partial [Thermodesulfobacteriota bacterium]
AHEIRNPMASISGSIQVMKAELDQNDFNSRLMNIISREIDRLNNLISDFLNFARPKEINIKNFTLDDLIVESLELFKNSHHWTGNIQIITKFPFQIMIDSDPEQIKQVFWNLFLNACEAMPDGGILTISTDVVEEAKYQGEKMAQIIVRDTGPGFNKEAMKKIFTPFFTTKERGSGLGLATVKRIIDGLTGKVNGINHIQGGAEITLTLPTTLPPSAPLTI